MKRNDLLLSCSVGHGVDCSPHVSHILTSVGICSVLNAGPFDDMYRKSQYTDIFKEFYITAPRLYKPE